MKWWGYVKHNHEFILHQVGQHTWLALLPVAIALVISLPIGFVARRFRHTYPPLLAAAGILYAIPSLALFVVLPGILGTRILDPVNIVVALTIYSVALLVRTVVDGLASVPEQVLLSATAVGFKPLRRLVQVELPIAVPVILSGVRVATVTNISLVNVGALIGIGGIGELFTDGFQRSYYTPIIVGIVLSVLLAVLADTAIVLTQRLLTPWVRAGESR